jgi:glycyl-tRNA synthetase
LAHYARAAEDIEFLFPFGWQEIEGIHDRGDWDLSRHTEYSGKELAVTDEPTKERFTPMVIETSVGIDRTTLALLVAAYREEELDNGEMRVVMGFHPALAPIKVAILPLSKKLSEPTREIQKELRKHFNVFYDEAGNIGRRYRRQDEVGTPFCVTYDFDSTEDGCVTVRERDSMNQERIAIDDLRAHLTERLEEGS